VDFLSQVWPSVAAEFTRREIELNIVHVRTPDFRATPAPAPGTAAALSAGDPASSVAREEARRHAGTGHPAACSRCEAILVASRPAWSSEAQAIPDRAFRMAA